MKTHITSGFVALTSVLIVSAVFLMIAIGLSLASVTTVKQQLKAEQYAEAKGLAEACVNRALLELTQQLDYTGSESEDFTTGSCTILPVISLGDTGWRLQVEGTVATHVYRLEVEGTYSSDGIEIDHYQAVTNFSV